jgi:septum site-determining protein MinC
MRAKLDVKGLRDGILITIGEGSVGQIPWEDLHTILLEHLDDQKEFLRGARLALDVGNQVLKAAELGQLRNEISERQITLWAVLSNSPTTETTAQTLGLATRLSKPRPELTSSKINTTIQGGEDAIFIQRTLRSGFSLQYPGHVIVLGDVNPGAEVIASGSVIVWGRMRGLVHAGAEGDEKACVCALDLSPTQLRIAGRIAISPKQKAKIQPEIARLINGQVMAELWDPKRSKGKDI